jgi:hypothetical protein
MLDAMTRPFFTSDILLAQSPNLEAVDRHDEGYDFAEVGRPSSCSMPSHFYFIQTP